MAPTTSPPTSSSSSLLTEHIEERTSCDDSNLPVQVLHQQSKSEESLGREDNEQSRIIINRPGIKTGISKSSGTPEIVSNSNMRKSSRRRQSGIQDVRTRRSAHASISPSSNPCFVTSTTANTLVKTKVQDRALSSPVVAIDTSTSMSASKSIHNSQNVNIPVAITPTSNYREEPRSESRPKENVGLKNNFVRDACALTPMCTGNNNNTNNNNSRFSFTPTSTSTSTSTSASISPCTSQSQSISTSTPSVPVSDESKCGTGTENVHAHDNASQSTSISPFTTNSVRTRHLHRHRSGIKSSGMKGGARRISVVRSRKSNAIGDSTCSGKVGKISKVGNVNRNRSRNTKTNTSKTSINSHSNHRNRKSGGGGIATVTPSPREHSSFTFENSDNKVVHVSSASRRRAQAHGDKQQQRQQMQQEQQQREQESMRLNDSTSANTTPVTSISNNFSSLSLNTTARNGTRLASGPKRILRQSASGKKVTSAYTPPSSRLLQSTFASRSKNIRDCQSQSSFNAVRSSATPISTSISSPTTSIAIASGVANTVGSIIPSASPKVSLLSDFVNEVITVAPSSPSANASTGVESDQVLNERVEAIRNGLKLDRAKANENPTPTISQRNEGTPVNANEDENLLDEYLQEHDGRHNNSSDLIVSFDLGEGVSAPLSPSHNDHGANDKESATNVLVPPPSPLNVTDAIDSGLSQVENTSTHAHGTSLEPVMERFRQLAAKYESRLMDDEHFEANDGRTNPVGKTLSNMDDIHEGYLKSDGVGDEMAMKKTFSCGGISSAFWEL